MSANGLIKQVKGIVKDETFQRFSLATVEIVYPGTEKATVRPQGGGSSISDVVLIGDASAGDTVYIIQFDAQTVVGLSSRVNGGERTTIQAHSHSEYYTKSEIITALGRKQDAYTNSLGGFTIGPESLIATGLSLNRNGYVSAGAPSTAPTAFGPVSAGMWLGWDSTTGTDATGAVTTASKPKMSFYADGSNYLQWTGTKLIAKAANFTLDGSGNLTASNVNLTGSITATGGKIGDFVINPHSIAVDSFMIDTSVPSLALGAASGFSAGTGIWMGYDATGTAGYKFRVGVPGGVELKWDNSGNLTFNGSVTSSSLNLALQPWTTNIVFTSTSATVVSWGSGTISLLASGGPYSITAGNTGTMAALTYIYLNTAVSTTALQVTTTYSTAVGAGKLLIAVAQNGTNGASVIVYGGGSQPIINGGIQITAGSILAANIAANTITASQIASGTITATQIAAGTITGTQIAATTITASNIAANTITASQIASGTITATQLTSTAINSMTITGATIQTDSSGARILLSGKYYGGLIGYGPTDTYDPDFGTGTYQIRWDKRTGRFWAGAGSVVIDNYGIGIDATIGGVQALYFTSGVPGAANIIGQLIGSHSGTTDTMELKAWGSGNGLNGTLSMGSIGAATKNSLTSLWAMSSTTQAYIDILANSTGSVRTITMSGDTKIADSLNLGTATVTGAGNLGTTGSIKQSTAIYARVYDTSAQSVPNGIMTGLVLGSVRSDGFSMHSATKTLTNCAKTASSATVTGSGFNGLMVGDSIQIPGTVVETKTISAIASDTSLTVDSNCAYTATGVTITRASAHLICKVAGTYLIGAGVRMTSNATGRRSFQISTGLGTTRTVLASSSMNADAGGGSIFNLNTVYTLAVNDEISAQVYQTSGGALNTLLSNNDSPELWMARLA